MIVSQERLVMAGLVPAIHVFLSVDSSTWMPGEKPGHDANYFNGLLTKP
jgi:hypothetical protein